MEAIGTVSVARRQFHSGEQIGSPNLRDFLRINDEENYNTSGRNFSGPTLDSILHLERDSLGPVRVRSNRTLLDIIRDDPFHSNNNNNSSRKTWRHRLRICLQGSGHNSGDDSAVPSHRESPTRLNGSSTVDGSDPSPAVMIEGVSTRESGGGEGEQPGRMSLMALLEETDRQVGFVMELDEREEQEEKPAEKCGGGGGEHSCCVCMVRHKGAAFIPCGHTFCRLCCRELWVQRGNCPLCNTLILEILDLF